jgi:hypothetical protein
MKTLDAMTKAKDAILSASLPRSPFREVAGLSGAIPNHAHTQESRKAGLALLDAQFGDVLGRLRLAT